MEKYIESCLALYDLKVGFHYYNNADPTYFLERTLSNGLSIRIRSDGYYIFNFRNATIGTPIKHQDNLNSLYVRNERLEIMHAFLACLRYLTQQITRQFHTFDMNFIDNFIICSYEHSDLDLIINDSNLFSSDGYQSLCKQKLERQKISNFTEIIDNSQIINNSIDIIEKVNDNYAIYILGIFYRAAVYHKLGLDLQTVLFLRSIFEWLVQKKYAKKPKKEDYHNFLCTHQIIGDEYCIMNELRNLRNTAIHELRYPKTDNIKNPITKSFKILERIFCKEFDIIINM